MNSTKREEPAVRQILVAMDTLSDYLAVLESAAELTAQLDGELTGLFVEDTDLLRAAGLPVSLEVMLWTARERNPTEMEMARALRALAARIRNDLARVAEHARVRWSFKVVRGPRIQVFMEAGAGSDLMVVGPARSSRVPRYSQQQPSKKARSVCLLYTGTAAARRGLVAAMKLADQSRVQVKVLSVCTSLDEVRSTESRMDEHLQDARLAVRCLDLKAGEDDQVLIEQLAKLEPRALIVPADNRLTQDPLLFQRLQSAVNCAIVFVR